MLLCEVPCIKWCVGFSKMIETCGAEKYKGGEFWLIGQPYPWSWSVHVPCAGPVGSQMCCKTDSHWKRKASALMCTGLDASPPSPGQQKVRLALLSQHRSSGKTEGSWTERAGTWAGSYHLAWLAPIGLPGVVLPILAVQAPSSPIQDNAHYLGERECFSLSPRIAL